MFQTAGDVGQGQRGRAVGQAITQRVHRFEVCHSVHGVVHTAYRQCIYRVLRISGSNAVIDALQLVHVGRVAAGIADGVLDHQGVGAGTAVFQAAVDVDQSQRL